MWFNYITYFGKKLVHQFYLFIYLFIYQSYTYFLQIQKIKAEDQDYATRDMTRSL